jgi:hypothetical protein
MGLFLDLLLFFVANGFVGDLVEETEHDGGEDEPERDQDILGVAEHDILGEVLETKWGWSTKKLRTV